jgi:MFS family permease
MEPQQTRPSMGRWYILVLISLMYLITYLDRVNISTAAPVISKEFGFDKITMGIIFSAFVWAYAMFQVPGGWLGDRFGARNVLTIIVSYWSVMTGDSLSFRYRRSRRVSGSNPRHAALVSAAGARFRPRDDVWAFWLDPDASVVEKYKLPTAASAAMRGKPR